MKTLAERIKNLPKGTKLYSPCYGEVTFVRSTSNGITCRDSGDWEQGFLADGRVNHCGECMLFPSKEERDWEKFLAGRNKFDVRTLQPFDKVLVRSDNYDAWIADLFGYEDGEGANCTGGSAYPQCVPYNDDTKYLLGTEEQAPEYYITWKEE